MTPARQPHPQRCVDDAFGKVRTEWKSQCRFFWWDSKTPECEIGCTCSGMIEKISIWDMRQIEKRGCASHSSTPAPAFPNSTQLIEMAHTDWKNREERRGIHDENDFCAGWITGYLTRHEEAAHAATLAENKRVLDKMKVRVDTFAPDEGIHLEWVLRSEVDACIESLREGKKK